MITSPASGDGMTQLFSSLDSYVICSHIFSVSGIPPDKDTSSAVQPCGFDWLDRYGLIVQVIYSVPPFNECKQTSCS